MKIDPEVYRYEDGRHIHTIRQSLLGDFYGVCNEKTRYQLFGLTPRIENDAAAVGTGCHQAFENTLNAWIEGDSASLEDAIDTGIQKYREIAKLPNFVQAKYTHDGAERLIREGVTKWWNQILPQLDPVATETHFSDVLLHADDFRTIHLTGTMDYMDTKLGRIDWKTAGKPYRQADKQKSDIQSRVYKYADLTLDGINPYTIKNPVPFTFVVMVHGKPDVQVVTVTREANDFWFLKKQAIGYAQMVENSLMFKGSTVAPEETTWPVNDASYLCTPKWCPAWAQCAGKGKA